MRIVSRWIVTFSLALVGVSSSIRPPLNAVPVSITLSTWIKTTYPSQAAAKEVSTDPRTKRWALLIGLNDYPSPILDAVGSRQDAEELNNVLLRLGWRSDHIMLIRDGRGTAQHIIDGIRWLAIKTTTASHVVFHYAGHENYTQTTADGDSEARDVEIWAADNRYILDGILGREMNAVRAYHMWIDLSTCRARGFDDAGMFKPGRILTYSSAESEYSYESADWHHSVFGYFVINNALYYKNGDADHNGKVSVEEAYAYARPWVLKSTGNLQHPAMLDYVTGPMYLTIP